MNKHTSRQQSMNANNRIERERGRDTQFETVKNFKLNDEGDIAGTYPVPEKYKSHPRFKTGRNIQIYISTNGDIRGMVIDGEVIFYRTNEQQRELSIQRILNNSQERSGEILVSELEAIGNMSEVNEALHRKKRAQVGADRQYKKI